MSVDTANDAMDAGLGLDAGRAVEHGTAPES